MLLVCCSNVLLLFNCVNKINLFFVLWNVSGNCLGFILFNVCFFILKWVDVVCDNCDKYCCNEVSVFLVERLIVVFLFNVFIGFVLIFVKWSNCVV